MHRRSAARQVLVAVLIALVALCALPATASAEAPKIAVIDLRRAVFDTEDGLRVDADLRQLQDTRQGELEAKKQNYLKLKAEYETLAKNKSSDKNEIRRILKALEKSANDLQSAEVLFRRELQRQEFEKTTPIREKVLGMVRRLAGQNGYDLVLLKDVAPFYRKDLDITDRIIQMYNASQGQQPEGPKPKAPAKK